MITVQEDETIKKTLEVTCSRRFGGTARTNMFYRLVAVRIR
jgi:hypothetical protein